MPLPLFPPTCTSLLYSALPPSAALSPVLHVPFTWGSPWPTHLADPQDYTYIVASDILLYVSAYPALADSLRWLFAAGGVREFVMSWNRRIAHSAQFFQMMFDRGFRGHHHGECVYSFYLDSVDGTLPGSIIGESKPSNMFFLAADGKTLVATAPAPVTGAEASQEN